MTDDYDMTPDETHSPPSCDDCGNFNCKEWDEDKAVWKCPLCLGEEEMLDE